VDGSVFDGPGRAAVERLHGEMEGPSSVEP